MTFSQDFGGFDGSLDGIKTLGFNSIRL